MPDPNFEICQAKKHNDFSPKLLHLFGVFGNKCLPSGIYCNYKEEKEQKMSVVAPAVAMAVIANPVGVAIAVACVVVFLAIALPIALAVESVSKRIANKRSVAYRLANQCKGITKKGEQCLNWSDCPHHAN
jgi:hypothetical protein